MAKRQERQEARVAKRQKQTESKEARRAPAAGGWWPGLRQRHATNGRHPSHPDAITNADLKSVSQKPVKPRDDSADFGEALKQLKVLPQSTSKALSEENLVV